MIKNCDKCESNGLQLIKVIDVPMQISLNKIRGLLKYSNELRQKCYADKGYYIVECETKKQLVPKSDKQITRYQCSNKHEMFIERENKKGQIDDLQNL